MIVTHSWNVPLNSSKGYRMDPPWNYHTCLSASKYCYFDIVHRAGTGNRAPTGIRCQRIGSVITLRYISSSGDESVHRASDGRFQLILPHISAN